ncbi:DUF1707 domain-containing protein [Amycolatopsis sp., V23-08]|uniref:DUF1707 domain-containing protein n=1 Tax=Amycolatopsis heterodermiae TaxID=3110235 RepID=A0ABU5R3V0_9PSEU|nr:DUF1707 domain-containing protein [Amycolatopsis sp., V23-08]MEA5360887.1 DUF1707 domain-containing protein [Amycolatopsis sp., V23-08]
MSESVLGATLPADSPAAEGIRCSDAEREQVRAVLYTAAGEGRLTMDEVEERLARIEAARYRHELTGVTADLPGPERNSPGGWRPIMAAAGRTLAAELAVLLGRTPEPSPGRRRWLLALTVLIGLLITAAVIVGAVHGFGADGFEPHGLDAGPGGEIGH